MRSTSFIPSIAAMAALLLASTPSSINKGRMAFEMLDPKLTGRQRSRRLSKEAIQAGHELQDEIEAHNAKVDAANAGKKAIQKARKAARKLKDKP